ncbi:hypothetical protein OHT76_17340 [Streptomyces sp. NBC_00287]|uniref:hypothetical protein n=1 Tax=Streptomyces sp. NBC_00287 TaxID=2975702 RepID=UPI002E2E51BD|nr:hypothetical protein [Streptomyces sp. NBC_00287]
MSKRQVQKMLRLMASGEPVELTSAMASVKKLARLAFIAQQFGYEYADVRQGGGHNSSLVMLLVPDHSPQARARAAQNWAQYPNAGDGVSVPPLVPDAFELLKARINFDLTGKSAEKRMVLGALGGSLGCLAVAMRSSQGSVTWVIAGVLWILLLGALGVGFAVNRKRNAKFAARLQAAGFQPVNDATGRLRYLPAGVQVPGQANPFASGPYGGGPQGGMPYGGGPQGGPYGAAPTAPAPGPYAQQPYPQQPQPQAYPQQQQPYPPQQPYPQQNPHWQPPTH